MERQWLKLPALVQVAKAALPENRSSIAGVDGKNLFTTAFIPRALGPSTLLSNEWGGALSHMVKWRGNEINHPPLYQVSNINTDWRHLRKEVNAHRELQCRSFTSYLACNLAKFARTS